MKVQILFRPRLILIFLLAVIGVNALSALLFLLLDRLINTDLYRYGLQFDYAWAGQYWTYSQFLIGLPSACILFMVLSIAAVLIYRRRGSEGARIFGSLLVVFGVLTNIFSIVLFSLLDHVVHTDLYRFGLQFEYGWAGQYWFYARLFLNLQLASMLMSLASTALIFFSKRLPVEVDFSKLISIILFGSGAAALVFSVIYNSSIPALAGLGLLFWGIIIGYISKEDYVRGVLLDATALSSLVAMDEMFGKLEFKGKAVYLPPKYLRDVETSKVYMAKKEGRKLPAPEEVVQEGRFEGESEGILLIPPGNELTRLFEKTLRTSFAKVEPANLEQSIAKLIEDLEIAQNVKFEFEKDSVKVRIENSVYSNFYKEAKAYPRVVNSLGCPISSAIACVLAKSVGKPITINNHQISDDGKNIDIEYSVQEEPEEKLQ